MKKFSFHKINFNQIEWNKFTEKCSAAVIYAVLSSAAINFFFVPGNIYSSGITGLAQILTTLSKDIFNVNIPLSLMLYLINIPLFVLAWFKIGKKFTLYTILTVSLSSLFIEIFPEIVLSTDPIINAIFGGILMGCGIGYGLRSGISSGGLDILSLSIQSKYKGVNVGHISLFFNTIIVLITGILFGKTYMFYSLLTIFFSSRMTDAIYTRQRRMQVMIITKYPEKVSSHIQDTLHRGVTIINNAEGAYSHDQTFVLITIISRAEYSIFKNIMIEADKNAFVSISENVKILGNFENNAD